MEKTTRKLLYQFILFLAPLICFSQDIKSPEIKSVELVDRLIIKDDTSRSIKSSLSRIFDIAVDQKGHIYIADEGSMSIKVFNRKGEYVQTIGHRGRGPGEFLSFKEISMFDDNKLIVVDKRQFRITKFNTDGEVLDTFLMSKETQEVVFFSQIFPLDNNNLVLYKKFGRVGNEDEIFHVWDHNFSNELYQFGSFKNLGFSEGFAREIVKLAVGSFAMLNNQKLIFAPSIYEGTIFTYQKKNKQWKEKKKIEGYSIPIPSYQNYSEEKESDEAMVLHTQKGEVKGDIFVSSMGIFNTENFVVHFSMINLNHNDQNENNWQLGVEIFDKELNYLGYFPLETLNNNVSLIQTGIRDKDSSDNFYMISKEYEYPAVRMFSLDIEFK